MRICDSSGGTVIGNDQRTTSLRRQDWSPNIQAPVYGIKYSPFINEVFLSCSADWTIKLWHIERQNPVINFQSAVVSHWFALGHAPVNWQWHRWQKSVNSIAWSPKSSVIFACVNESAVEVWNLQLSTSVVSICHWQSYWVHLVFQARPLDRGNHLPGIHRPHQRDLHWIRGCTYYSWTSSWVPLSFLCNSVNISLQRMFNHSVPDCRGQWRSALHVRREKHASESDEPGKWLAWILLSCFLGIHWWGTITWLRQVPVAVW